jgi:hypothetical protein
LTCSATNKAGVPASASVVAKVDLHAPTIAGMPAAGCTLWPPNHKLVEVANVIASDALSQVVPGSLAITVTCNGGRCDRDDFVVQGGRVKLRAERERHEKMRVYTIQAAALDLAGNLASARATCTVPRHGPKHHGHGRDKPAAPPPGQKGPKH